MWLGHCSCGWFGRRCATETGAWVWVVLHVLQVEHYPEDEVAVERPFDA